MLEEVAWLRSLLAPTKSPIGICHNDTLIANFIVDQQTGVCVCVHACVRACVRACKSLFLCVNYPSPKPSVAYIFNYLLHTVSRKIME